MLFTPMRSMFTVLALVASAAAHGTVISVADASNYSNSVNASCYSQPGICGDDLYTFTLAHASELTVRLGAWDFSTFKLKGKFSLFDAAGGMLSAVGASSFDQFRGNDESTATYLVGPGQYQLKVNVTQYPTIDSQFNYHVGLMTSPAPTAVPEPAGWPFSIAGIAFLMLRRNNRMATRPS